MRFTLKISRHLSMGAVTGVKIGRETLGGKKDPQNEGFGSNMENGHQLQRVVAHDLPNRFRRALHHSKEESRRYRMGFVSSKTAR